MKPRIILKLTAHFLLLSAMSGSAPIHYVDVNNANPTPPYTNWSNAATAIQDAVDAAVAGDQILVTNGVYQAGGRTAPSENDATPNRVAVTKAIMLRSVNGAALTVIQGYHDSGLSSESWVRCVYLSDGSSLIGFTLTNGWGGGGGGGVSCQSANAVVSNCVLTGNSAGGGGGAYGGTLYNCTLSGNTAHFVGGGAGNSTLYNCTITGNSTGDYVGGGGAIDCILNNCTITDNSGFGATVLKCTLNNCVVYYNNSADGRPSGNNYADSVLNYSCTTPLPTGGIGNLTNAPLFVDYASANLRLQSNSPCINAGSNAFAPDNPDLEGNPRIVGGRVDIGAYEFQVPQPPIFSIRYVNVNSADPVPPYTNWATAATTIQDAVDAALAGDQVLVTNGVYQAGSGVVDETTNRVTVMKPITLQSVNGSAVTLIQGQHIMGCVYLSAGTTLVGFTLANGWGSGVWCESASAVVSNCVLTGNSAGAGGGAYGGTLYSCTISSNSVGFVGGGAYQSTLYNCVLSGNSTHDYVGGAGAFDCTLNNCTITGNSAFGPGSGAYGCTLNNCIVYHNNGTRNNMTNEDNHAECFLNFSCTTPLPAGIGNLTNAPLFVDFAGGNLRLQSNSPCINAGSNASAPVGPDLDGNPRIGGGTVDMGAYEFQLPQSAISYAWLQQYNLPTDGSADNTDADDDGLNNWQEWRTGTNPTNALSVLRLASPAREASGLIVSWKSVAGLNYFLERSTHLEARPPFLPLATNIAGQPGTTTFTDTNAVGIGPFFYRVGVQE